MIFETNRLLVRELSPKDLDPFHEMQSNPKVMQYADGEPKSYDEHKKELKDLCSKYIDDTNDFWIYAIVLKETNAFIGTVALVKDDADQDEIGFRFLERFWNRGFGFEVCMGLISHTKLKGFQTLVAYVSEFNVASIRILQKCGFYQVPWDTANEYKFELEI